MSASPVAVQLINAGLKLDQGKWVVPPFALRLGEDLRLSKCIAIQHNGDPYAVVLPVVEAIRFYYAVSTDLAHLAFSGGLRVSPNDVYDPLLTGLLRDRSRMVVRLRQWLSDDDGWIIGRALACPISGAGLSRVYESLLASSVNRGPAFPECKLPFEGTTKWKARGSILPGRAPGTKRWLIYELLRCTASFPFEELEVIRTNDSTRADPETDLPDEEKLPGWATQILKPEFSGDEKIQSAAAPDAATATTQIPLAGERFAALAGKSIQKALKEQCRYKSSSFVRPAELDWLATGDKQGSDDSVGQVKFVGTSSEINRKPTLPASLETLSDLVATLNNLHGVVACVRADSVGAAYIPLTKPRRHAQWAYLDSRTKRRRQVGVVDIRAGVRAASFVEFELRRGESFAAALLCSRSNNFVSDSALAALLQKLSGVQGVWAKVSRQHESEIKIRPYNHKSNTLDRFAAALLREMEKAAAASED